MITSNGYVLDESERRLGALAAVPEHERQDRDALWDRLRRDGYLYLKGHLNPDTVNDFRGYYFDRLKDANVTAPGTDPRDGIGSPGPVDRAVMREALFGEIVPGAEYQQLCAHPAIAGWFAWFLQDDVHLHRRKIIRHTKPGEAGIGTATQAHYDLVYLRGGSDRVLSMWIPLGDCPLDRGGLAYLENSHHWVMAQEREGTLARPAASITADLPGLAEQHDTRWLVTDYEAGDVMVHSAHIVHASTDNVDPANRVRLSTDIRYQRQSEPIDWRWQEHWNFDDGL
ncbi:phytanoyl-CoA dioxygenase (plasmid) [Arthrobacter sp. ERGS1:01]|uniref:phytanoyl-CoA dioxygenase family protein n=1 Tax=Arthrobacter sp. ERGS1:01 TaxID=1704044 RepID=UPI0006B4E53E|nr:phytanoyl-CoA dioxygenase family protein [Arthrobacter sp. ERGS1:01]ALE04190.1 phytanoyl-CoA dioxygenase [Arthrobacter sp. ERGS1:01]